MQGGHYASESDVIAEAFRLLEQRDSPPGTAGQQPGAAQATAPEMPLPTDEMNRRLLAAGLVIRFPDPSQASDDAEDLPIEVDGEPLSETIIRERRQGG